MLLRNSLFSKLFVYACKHNSTENVLRQYPNHFLNTVLAFWSSAKACDRVAKLDPSMKITAPYHNVQMSSAQLEILYHKLVTGHGILRHYPEQQCKTHSCLPSVKKKEYLVLCLEMAEKLLQTVYTTANDPYPISAIRKFAVACRTSLGF